MTNSIEIAVQNGNLDEFKQLIQNGSDYNHAMCCASKFGQLKSVKYLINNGANIHAGNEWALHWASKFGQLKVVEYLVEIGANIHAGNNLAIRWASPKVCLLQRRA